MFGTIYAKGQILFQQGAYGDTMFVIQSGAVELTRLEAGREIILAVMERGDFFGEMALIDSGPRSATAKTVQTSRLLQISRNSMLEHASQDPSIMINLMAAMCMRIEKTNSLLQSIIYDDEFLRGLTSLPKEPAGRTLGEQRDGFQDSEKIVNECMEDDSTGRMRRESDVSSWHPLFDNSDLFSECKAGQTIFCQGDPGEKMYLILNGEVEICHQSDGDRFRLAVLRENDFFGEMALITGSPRSSTVLALTDVKLVSIGREEFLTMMRSRPEMGLYIIESLIARLRSTNAAIHDPSRCADVIRQIAPPKFRKRSRIRVAVISLASCGGCAASLLRDPGQLAELTNMIDICYCPMLMDAPDFSIPFFSYRYFLFIIRVSRGMKQPQSTEGFRKLFCIGQCNISSHAVPYEAKGLITPYPFCIQDVPDDLRIMFNSNFAFQHFGLSASWYIGQNHPEVVLQDGCLAVPNMVVFSKSMQQHDRFPFSFSVEKNPLILIIYFTHLGFFLEQ